MAERAVFPAAVAAALVTLAGSVVSCAPRAPSGRVAAATIAPLADLLKRVAGEGWTVRTVVPPGTSPHVFEPVPGDVRKVADSTLVVVAGAGYDTWMMGLLAACASGATVHDAASTVGVTGEAAGHEHGSSHGSGHREDDPDRDPHWWLSPVLAARSAIPLGEVLSRIDPSGAAGYRERARSLEQSLLRLDVELATLLAPVRGASFIAAHRAWGHFAARYGLRQAGAIEPIPGREPSPRELRALVDQARSGGPGRFFTEPQFPESAARVVAGEAGLTLELVDPIGGVPGRASYEEMMRWNGRAFARGLARENRS